MHPNSRTITLRSLIPGLEFQAPLGTITTSNEKGRTRVHIGGDAKGISIERMPSIRSDTYVRMSIGGDLNLSEVEALRVALTSLRAELLRSHSALIQVGSGGDVARSDLAGRVKIKLADGSVKTRTVPASQVEGRDKRLWIPRWLAIEKTGQRAFLGDVCLPEAAEAGLATLERELSRQLALLSDAAAPLQEAERQAAPLREAQYEKERKQRELLHAQAVAEREKLAQQVAAQQAASAKRVANLPLLATNVTVEGRDWTSKNGRFISTDWSVKNADVRVSGKRAYIFRDGKQLFWKPLDKITIVQSESS